MKRIVFGTDGWRAGIAEDYTFEAVRYCTQGTAEQMLAEGLGERGVVVGYDMRFRSEDFARAVAEVLAGNGVRAWVATAPAPTPVLSYSILPLKAGGGIWITASHNPPTDNGFKLRSAYAGAAAPETLAKVEALIAAAQDRGDVRTMDYDRGVKEGLIVEFDPTVGYMEQLARLIDTKPLADAGLRVVADPMWGVGMGWFGRLLSGGTTMVREIHGERNPLFPRMERPEPIDDNLQDLLHEVRMWPGDVGLATDGDADRIGLVSEQGRFINQLEVYALLAYYLLEVRGWRGPLVKTLSTTSMAFKLGKLYDVPVYETSVGFKYVAPEFLRTNAIMGGEESGGFAFANHIPERDGILAGLFLLDLMVKQHKTPSQLLDTVFGLVGAHYYDRIDRQLDPADKPAVVARVKAAKPTTLAGLKVERIETTDGFRYLLEGGDWVLIRFSGTEAVIRVYCETTRKDKVQDLLNEGARLAGIEPQS